MTTTKPTPSEGLTQVISKLDRKNARFQEILTLNHSKPNTFTLKELATYYSTSLTNRKFGQDSAQEYFDNLLYELALPGRYKSIFRKKESSLIDSFFNKSAFNKYKDIEPQKRQLLTYLVKTSLRGESSYNRDFNLVENWSQKGDITSMSTYDRLPHLLYLIYRSPFANEFLHQIELLTLMDVTFNIDSKKKEITIDSNSNTNGVTQTYLSNFLPIIHQILQASPSKDLSENELENLKVTCLQVLIKAQTRNSAVVHVVDVEKPLASRFLNILESPMPRRPHVDNTSIFIALTLLQQIIGTSSIMDSVTTNRHSIVYGFQKFKNLTSLITLQPLLDTSVMETLDYSSLDIWAQVLSDEDLRLATEILNFSELALQFIVDSEQPLTERIELFDAHFDVNSTSQTLTFHGLPIWMSKIERFKRKFTDFITEVRISSQETIETTILPTVNTIEYAKQLVILKDSSFLAAHLKYVNSTFDVIISKDSETDVFNVSVRNSTNQIEAVTLELDDSITNFFELNSKLAEEFTKLYGKVVQ